MSSVKIRVLAPDQKIIKKCMENPSKKMDGFLKGSVNP